MAGYSKTPLFKKLGIKEGFKIYVKDPPEKCAALIAPLPDQVKIISCLSNEIDIIHFPPQAGQNCLLTSKVRESD